jgi:hypothetical protein
MVQGLKRAPVFGLVCALYWVLLTPGAFAQGKQAPWELLESARIAYEQNEFGNALALSNSARAAHELALTRDIGVLKRALSAGEVKKAGDDIGAVYAVLQKRSELSALGILDDIFLNYPKDFFNSSISNLLGWMEKRLAYPECDLLLGEIYEAEGEYGIAEDWYLKAWKNAAILDVPDQRYTILYRLASLASRQGNTVMQRDYLLMVLADDTLFNEDGTDSGLLQAMKRTVGNPGMGVSKLFLMYRHRAYTCLEAYTIVASLYGKGAFRNTDRSLSMGLAAGIIGVTRLEEALKRGDIHFEYTGLEKLLLEASTDPQVRKAAEQSGVWNALYACADSLSGAGMRAQASEILRLLALYATDPLIAKRSKNHEAY